MPTAKSQKPQPAEKPVLRNKKARAEAAASKARPGRSERPDKAKKSH